MPDVNQPTVFLAGGGTGGHLSPGLAVADPLPCAMPDAKLLFLCTTKEIDRVILDPSGFDFVPQPVLPLPKLTSVGGLLRFWRGWRETKDLVRKLIRERKPAVVLGLGGDAAGGGGKAPAPAGVPPPATNPARVPPRGKQNL